MQDALKSAALIVNDGKSHDVYPAKPETDSYIEVERAEDELSKGTSPFHKVLQHGVPRSNDLKADQRCKTS